MAPALPSQLEEKLRQLNILSAIDPEANNRWRAAPRLQALNGKAGGFLGNRKANADLLLEQVKESLDKRFELRDGVVVDKYVYSRPAAEDIIDHLAGSCDFVVTAIAD